MHLSDTIAAISTPPGTGGISIIRLSGERAVEIADRIFENPLGKKLKNAKTHTITHGFVKKDGKVLDEVLISVMLAPNTYTREDVVEINCHGGTVSTREILSAVLESGARLADAGEFTKRAFVNGRIDLCEAESVIDIINAKTSAAHSLSVNQLCGSLSKEINAIREKLLALTSHLQVLIDFADEDLEPLTDGEFLNGIIDAKANIEKLLKTSLKGMIMRDGVKTAIVGKPNVGKSSLLNLLCGSERAIVTEIEGTTRDSVTESVSLGNVVLNLADTAGIRDTDDRVESIGVEKSKEILSDADLVIYMTDASKTLDENDAFIIDSLAGKKAVALLNKCENGKAADITPFADRFDAVIDFSVKEKIGIERLASAVEKMFDAGEIAQSDDAVITDVRHRDALQKAKSSLESAVEAIGAGIPANMTFIDIENAITALGEITGQTVGEEIVDRIFHRFCVGK